MQLYDKPTWQLMWDMVENLGVAKGEVLSKQRVFEWFGKNYPKIKQSTLSAHLIRMSTNSPTRVHYGAKPKSDDLLYQIDGSHFRLYDKGIDPPPIYGVPTKGSTVKRKERQPQRTLAIVDEIHDPVLRERVSRLGSPPLDTLIREAGVVLSEQFFTGMLLGQ